MEGGHDGDGTLERVETPPDESRCCRTDGKSWRCKRSRSAEGRFCEVHQRKRAMMIERGKGSLRKGGRRSVDDGEDTSFRSSAVVRYGREILLRKRRAGRSLEDDGVGSEEDEEDDEEPSVKVCLRTEFFVDFEKFDISFVLCVCVLLLFILVLGLAF